QWLLFSRLTRILPAQRIRVSRRHAYRLLCLRVLSRRRTQWGQTLGAPFKMCQSHTVLLALRIAQLASPPDFPALPQPIIFRALGLVGGIVLASAAALLLEALACFGTYDDVSRGSAEAATDVRQRAETARNRTSFNLPVPGVAQALSATHLVDIVAGSA